MKFVAIFFIFTLQIASNSAISRTKAEKQIDDLKSSVDSQMKRIEQYVKESNGAINATLEKIFEEVLLTKSSIGNLNTATFREWESKVNKSGVDIKECIPILNDLSVIDEALLSTTKKLYDQEYQTQAQQNNDQFEEMKKQFYTDFQRFLDNPSLYCEDTDEKCLENLELTLWYIFALFMDKTARELETTQQWLMNPPISKQMFDLLKQFKIDSADIVNKMLNCVVDKIMN